MRARTSLSDDERRRRRNEVQARWNARNPDKVREYEARRYAKFEARIREASRQRLAKKYAEEVAPRSELRRAIRRLARWDERRTDGGRRRYSATVARATKFEVAQSAMAGHQAWLESLDQTWYWLKCENNRLDAERARDLMAKYRGAVR